MCGIVGSINLKWKENPLRTLSHRGPDSVGSIIVKNVFLGHTRLSIQDLSSLGNQPMYSNDKRFIITFNGEIYNHWEIRKVLLKKGYEFISDSDTETLLYSWSEWGPDSIKKLNGIFAFAIYDTKINKLYITRDNFGVKPLYIYRKKNKIAFSSEIKTFLGIKNFDFSIDYKSILNYLTFLWSPGSQTMYAHVKKLTPGSTIEVDIDSVSINTIDHSYKDENIENEFIYTEQQWIKKVDTALNKAVERQMLSDAPLGFFLSGGLDSSLLVSIAKAQFPNEKFECFTIDQYRDSTGEGFLDDLPYAKKIAKNLNVSLNIIDNRDNWIKDFDKMIWYLDEPQGDLAPINVIRISEIAKSMGIKVLIGGTGGDDIFSGYRRHQALAMNQKFMLLPKSILKLFSEMIAFLPSSSKNISRLKKFSRDWGEDSKNQILGYFNWLPTNKFAHCLLSEEVKNEVINFDPYTFGKSLLDEYSNLSLLNQMLMLEQKSFLVDHNLNYTDKLSMSVGVEARVPFLDKEIVKIVNKMPSKYKVRGNTAKYLLKKVAEKYLPKDVIYRSKTGFGAPIRKLMSIDFEKKIMNSLNESKLVEQGIFNYSEINRMIKLNKSKKEDFSHNILSLLSIQSWLEQFPWKKS